MDWCNVKERFKHNFQNCDLEVNHTEVNDCNYERSVVSIEQFLNASFKAISYELIEAWCTIARFREKTKFEKATQSRKTAKAQSRYDISSDDDLALLVPVFE